MNRSSSAPRLVGMILASALVSTGALARAPVPSVDVIESNMRRGSFGHCDVYRAFSARATADVKDAIDVGIGFCRRFSRSVYPRLSAAGQRWLVSTTRCLMRDMRRTFEISMWEEASAGDLFTFTASSHAQCYVDNGFCRLSARDLAAVLSVIDARALQQAPSLNGAWTALGVATLSVASSCATGGPRAATQSTP